MILIKLFKLVLPVLIPSWRFFDEIVPSPRVQFSVLDRPQDHPTQWREFRPRPAHLSGLALVRRLFWNPQWNEALFLVSCSERLVENGDAHCIDEIFKRIKSDLRKDTATPYVQFRLVFVRREGDELHEEVLFVSPPARLFDGESP